MPTPSTASQWFLSTSERGNDATILDRRHPDAASWTVGNLVRPLIHGSAYFAELLSAVNRMVEGDLLLFTDWRGDPDELLDGPGSEVSNVFAKAAARGVLVRGLIWRSHLDRFRFSEAENRHLGEEIDRAGGCCLLDMRVRPGGSHHQKLVVVRHPGRPHLDRAYVGGIDLCHSRHDDERHLGDPQRQAMSKVYGTRPAWHDVQVAIAGPAVGDVEAVFRERWDDPARLSRDPLRNLRSPHPLPMPAQLPDPAPVGNHAVQLLRTYPYRRPGYPFAPAGERSVARGLTKALANARRLIYVEDQYLWSKTVAAAFCQALESQRSLRVIAVVPRFPDQDGAVSGPPNLVGRMESLAMMKRAGGERVAVYGIDNSKGQPIYVHAKVCIIDDTWASVGSDNFNRRSWTHDSELSCAVFDRNCEVAGEGSEEGISFGQELRLALWREHLERGDGDVADLIDPASGFEAFVRAAAALDRWHASGRSGPRPPGRLRSYQTPHLALFTRLWATPVYKVLYDPDGRSLGMRMAGQL